MALCPRTRVARAPVGALAPLCSLRSARTMLTAQNALQQGRLPVARHAARRARPLQASRRCAASAVAADSATPASASAQAQSVELSLTRHAKFGECYCVVGSCESMGDWDITQAPKLSWSEGNVWEVDVVRASGAWQAARRRARLRAHKRHRASCLLLIAGLCARGTRRVLLEPRDAPAARLMGRPIKMRSEASRVGARGSGGGRARLAARHCTPKNLLRYFPRFGQFAHSHWCPSMPDALLPSPGRRSLMARLSTSTS